MGRRKGAKAGSEPAEAPVLALRMDGSTGDAPREEAAPGGYQTPCTLTGLGAGLSSGSLGWVFGFGEQGAAVVLSGVGSKLSDLPPPPPHRRRCLLPANISLCLTVDCLLLSSHPHQS